MKLLIANIYEEEFQLTNIPSPAKEGGRGVSALMSTHPTRIHCKCSRAELSMHTTAADD